MAHWYYSVKGKAEGPVSERILVENLRSGHLTLVDLVFKEGDTSWRTLGEIPEFREAVQASPLPSFDSTPITAVESSAETRAVSVAARALSGSGWIVLAGAKGHDRQIGPFTSEQVLAKLASGELQFSQYVWKPGYKRWMRIGNLPEFDRRRPDRDSAIIHHIGPVPNVDSDVPPLTREELMESVVRFIPASLGAPHDEEAPPEAAGDDLVPNPGLNLVRPGGLLAELPVSSGGGLSAEPSPQAERSKGIKESIEESEAGPDVRAVHQDDASPGLSLPVVGRAARSEVFNGFNGNGTAAPTTDVTSSARRLRRSRAHSVRRMLIALALGASAVASYSLVRDEGEEAHWFAGLKGVLAERLRDFNDHALLGGRDRSAQDPNMSSEISAISASPEASATSPAKVSETEQLSARPVLRSEGRGGGKTVQSSVPVQADPYAEMLRSIRQVQPGSSLPRVLEIIAFHLDGERPLLVFQTDVAVGEKVSASIRGRTGEILELSSYSRSFELTRIPGHFLVLDLRRIGLPQGTFDIEVTSGSLKRKESIFVGKSKTGREFVNALRGHLKKIAPRQDAERRALFYSSRRFENHAKSLSDNFAKYRGQAGRWRAFYRDWQREVRAASGSVDQMFKDKGASEMAYPQEMAAFQAAVRRLKDQAAEINKAVTQNRGVASSRPLALAQEFARLRQHAARLAGRSNLK